MPGINISGLIFDAGPTQSSSLLQIGTEGSTANNASNPVTVDDVFFRVGGAEAGTVATAFVDNSNNSIIDDTWIWRADHGAAPAAGRATSRPPASWSTAATSRPPASRSSTSSSTRRSGTVRAALTSSSRTRTRTRCPARASGCRAPPRTATPPSTSRRASPRSPGTGWAATPTSTRAWPSRTPWDSRRRSPSGIHLYDLFTVFPNGSGGIESVVNGTGAAVSPTNGGPSDVVSASLAAK